jgi:hypothetical protein
MTEWGGLAGMTRRCEAGGTTSRSITRKVEE